MPSWVAVSVQHCLVAATIEDSLMGISHCTSASFCVCGLSLALFAELAAQEAATPVSDATKNETRTAGETIFFHERFDDSRLTDRKWYDTSALAISRENPFAGDGCVEYRWKTAGTAGGTGPMRRLFEPSESIYVRFHMRLSKGWGWTGRDYHPHLINILTTENQPYAGPAATHLTLYIEPQNGKLRLAAQDIQNKDAKHGLTQGPLKGGYNGKTYDSEKRLFTDDGWHFVEAYFQLNTLDLASDKPNADGIVRGWVDGELVVDRSDVILRSTDFPKMKFNQFLLAPYFGPGLLPHAQTLWIDELTVAAQRPDKAAALTK
jgi:hypothetical protein